MTDKKVSRAERVVVIGNGMFGYKFCEKLLEKDREKNRFEITAFGEEDLQMAPRSWYEKNGIQLFTGELIVELDRELKTVTSQKGRTVAYDKLIFATGYSAFVPPIDGVEKNGVFVYRTIEDLDAIIEYAFHAKKAAVLGGQLEQEMQELINVYSCEWKEVVKNPELRKRFRHFVNSDDVDPSLNFKEY